MTERGAVVAVARSADLAWESAACLSPAERERIETFSHDARRRDYAGGRVLLRRLLERVSGQPAGEHAIGTDAGGKPTCDAGYGVSIAHSGGLIACAVTTSGEIGVDIEVPDAGRDLRRLADEHFTPWENDWLASASAGSFFRLWVLKEAWLKSVGTGLAGGLDRLQCRLSGDGIDARFRTGEDGGLYLYDWGGVPVGLATSEPAGLPPRLLEWDGTEAALTEPGQRVAVLARTRC